MTLRIDRIEIGTVVIGDVEYVGADLNKVVNDVLARVIKIQTGMVNMNEQIKQFVIGVNAQFAAVNTALDNIVSDETALAKKIAELIQQIASGQSTLTQEDLDALNGVLVTAQAMAARTQQVADAVPDAVKPPDEPPV